MVLREIYIRDFDQHHVLEKSRDAIERIGLIVEEVDFRSKVIYARSKTSWISWGEDYYFEFIPHHGNNTLIRITASPSQFFNITAFATIENNINRYNNALNQLLQNQRLLR